MNKNFLLIALSLFSFNAQAGWNGAINVGGNTVDIEKKLTYPIGEFDSFVTVENYHSAYTNFHGQAAIGYDFLLTEKVDLNIEANADLFTGKAKYTITNWFLDDTVLAQERLKYGFSLFALPGYCYNQNVRFFIGPGVSRSQFTINSKNTAGDVGVTGNFEKWLTGWGGKAGVATRLTANTELLFTYQFTQYDNVSFTNIEPLSGELLRGDYKPAAHLFMIGLRMTMPTMSRFAEK